MARLMGSQLDLQKIPVLGLVPEGSTSAPSSPVAGQLWLDTSLTPARLKVYENGTWVLASQTGAELTANKGQSGGYASLDGTTKVPIAQIPTGQTGSTVPLGNDARFTDQRVPTDGSVTGGVAGTGVKLAANTITIDNIAPALKSAAAGADSLRQIGTGALQAMAGNTRLDTIAAPTGAVSLNSQEITNLGAPTASTSAARLVDIQNAQAGIDNKPSVRIVLTSNDTLSGLAARDGVTPVAGDRVLAVGQTTASQNGVWIAAAGAWTRATDTITSQSFWFVEEGTQGIGTQWKVSTSGPITVGTTALTIPQYGAATAYTWGNGLSATGNTIDVNVDGSSIEINADILRVKALGITNAMLAGSIDLTTKVTGSLPVANGGTGGTTQATARSGIGATGKYSATLGALTAGAETTITHNLGTSDVVPAFRLASNGQSIDFNWRVIDNNNIGVTPDLAFSASAIKVAVIG